VQGHGGAGRCEGQEVGLAIEERAFGDHDASR
jgi:hypothetical protein